MSQKTMSVAGIMGLALVGTALPAVAGTASSAEAMQPGFAQEDARWVVVTQAGTPLRAWAGERYYPVLELEAGAVLQRDSADADWTRVRYPAAVTPFVPAAEAVETDDPDVIRLIQPSQLKAPSRLWGIAGSWWRAYEVAFPVGTEFEVMGRETGSDGATTAYAVRLPSAMSDRPYGFVLNSSVRDATPAEIAAFMATRGGTPAGEQASDQAGDQAGEQDDTPTAQPEVEQPAEETGAPAGESPAASASDGDDGEALPTNLPGIPVEDVNQGEAGDSEGEQDPMANQPIGTEAPAAGEQATGGEAEGQPAQPDEVMQGGGNDRGGVVANGQVQPARLKELEDAFNAARRLPRAELDETLDELLAEYTRAAEAARENGGEDSVIRALEARVEWIEIRIATRDKRRELQAFLAESDETRQATEDRIAEWRSAQGFDYVARVLVSTVYDGRRLPRMYRLVEDDALTGPRTLGYIPADSTPSPSDFIGQMVGVRGSISFEPSSKLRIVDVDSFEAVPEE